VGNENLVKYLVEHGADINKKNVEGRTPLTIARDKGYMIIANYLVKRGV